MATYPLAVFDDSISIDAGNYIIRSPFSYNKANGAVVYAGDIPENAFVRLSRGTREEILNGVKQAVITLRHLTSAKDQAIQAILCISCAGRKLMLGLDAHREIVTIMESMSGVQYAVNGLYSYGEIGPLNSEVEQLKRSRFHNTSIVLCAF